LKSIVERLRRDGKRVVWTNGCFDILHVGHITYLLRARKQGDVMIVGLNSDASVRENKGPDRPVVNEQDRAVVLSALECVDYVTIFDDKTPMPLLDALKPDVYAKGGDYTIDTIVQEERRLVEGYGGSIAIIPGLDGQSTTNIINKIAGKG
jgi:D-beta-D-heptose 7-phosphate kinase/D-beta-D-heptose 1-phosphate adenosyltransferase